MEVLRIIDEVPWKHSKHLGAFMPTHQLSNKMFEADDPNFKHNSRDPGVMTNAFACYRETCQEERCPSFIENMFLKPQSKQSMQ